MKGQNQFKIDSMIHEISSLKEDTFKVLELFDLSQRLSDESNFDQAMNFSNEVLCLSERLNYKAGILEASSQIGNLNSLKYKYSEALQYYYKALNIAEELNVQLRVASILGSIGLIYKDQVITKLLMNIITEH
ncbi:MAG: hypothetical protein IPN15_05960 [Saprospiraceae bacterium]|nr:hypothetical protein [Candidatus Vicinibacter affinis]